MGSCPGNAWLTSGMATASPRLDALYQDYNREDAAADPIQIVRRYSDPADREVVGFCAAALAFGRVASVLNTHRDAARAILGPAAGGVRARVRSAAPHAAAARAWSIAGRAARDLVALLWLLRQMLDRSGSIEALLPRRLRSGERSGHRRRRSTASRAARWRSISGRPTGGASAARAGVLLLLPAAVGGQRVQAAEPVPALDGAPRRGRPRRRGRRVRRRS